MSIGEQSCEHKAYQESRPVNDSCKEATNKKLRDTM